MRGCWNASSVQHTVELCFPLCDRRVPDPIPDCLPGLRFVETSAGDEGWFNLLDGNQVLVVRLIAVNNFYFCIGKDVSGGVV